MAATMIILSTYGHVCGACFPAGLAGMRVLDVGCNAGFFSAEMKRLGREIVLGIEAVPRYLEQAKLVRNALHLDIDLRQLSVYEVSEKLGTFDVTLFLGVLYHLKDPLLGLERLAAVTKGTLVVESAIIRSPRPLTPGIRNYGGLAPSCNSSRIPRASRQS